MAPMFNKENVVDYNSKEGIEEFLDAGLSGLHNLIRLRAEDSKGKSSLKEFIILGKFVLDSFGQISTLEFDSKATYLQAHLKQVIPIEDFKRMFNRVTLTMEFGCSIPNQNHTCDQCNNGWRIDNCYDAVEVYGLNHDRTGTYRHKSCNALLREQRQSELYRFLIEQAFGDYLLFEMIPNEYWGNEGVSWCLVKTTYGNIKFGPRKRVLSISWDNVVDKALSKVAGNSDKDYDDRKAINKLFNAETLFPKEEVTKEGFLIHAWGEKKLVEYLQSIYSLICSQRSLFF